MFMDLLTDNIIVKGGWVMVPIILGSITAFALAIERGMVLWKSRLDTRKFTDFVSSLIKKGAIKEAKDYCATTLHPIGRVFSNALDCWGDTPAEIEGIMEHAGNEEVSRLEKNMSILLIIVGVEPMMGFLGTIIGLIKAFMAWEAAASTVTVEHLAAGIYQAMITTAGGLLVAIPFYIVYGLYTSRINAIARELNHHGEELLRVKTERPARKRQ
jgi:biopolymer transport protein ExbB